MKNFLSIVLPFLIITIGIFIDFPIQFMYKPVQVFFDHLVLAVGLLSIFLAIKNGRKTQRPFNWISYIISAFFLIIVGWATIWKLMFDFSGYYPVWTDDRRYINQTDTTEVITGQEFRISGSMIDWRDRKVKNLCYGLRWSRPAKTNNMNGSWRVIDFGNEFGSKKDTIVNFRNGEMIKKYYQ